MKENRDKIKALAKWREDTIATMQAIGLRPGQYEGVVGELADLATQKIIAEGSQFLFDFREHGAIALGERYECSKRTIYRLRHEALNIPCQKVAVA
jgi:hypothetical protein